MTEWAEAGRHLGPRPARTWRGARTQGRQGSKRPPGQDPDRAIHLSFYLSAGIAAHGPSEHATSAHRHIQIPLVCGTSRRQGISLSSTGTTLGTSLGSTPSEQIQIHIVCVKRQTRTTLARASLAPFVSIQTLSPHHHYVPCRERRRRRSALSRRRSGMRLSHLHYVSCSRRVWAHSPATPRGPYDRIDTGLDLNASWHGATYIGTGCDVAQRSGSTLCLLASPCLLTSPRCLPPGSPARPPPVPTHSPPRDIPQQPSSLLEELGVDSIKGDVLIAPTQAAP